MWAQPLSIKARLQEERNLPKHPFNWPPLIQWNITCLQIKLLKIKSVAVLPLHWWERQMLPVALTHHNFILNSHTTPCFMVHPVVGYWKSELLIASMNLGLIFYSTLYQQPLLENSLENIGQYSPVIPGGPHESSALTLAKKEAKREMKKISEDSIPDNLLNLCA